MNKNFLNNQNYILGRSEKKKLLSYFFVGLKYKKMLEILDYFSNIIFRGYLLFLMPFIIYYFIYNNLAESVSSKIFFGIILFVYPFLLRKDNNMYKNKKLSDFLLRKSSDFNRLFLGGFIKGVLYLWVLINYLLPIIMGEYFSIEIGGLIIMILILFLIPILYLDILNLLLFPFILIYFTFYSIFISIKTFLFNGAFKYKVIKNNFRSDILKPFEYINKATAENEFYIIKIKKG